MGGIGGYTDPERESYCRDIRREQMSKKEDNVSEVYDGNWKIAEDILVDMMRILEDLRSFTNECTTESNTKYYFSEATDKLCNLVSKFGLTSVLNDPSLKYIISADIVNLTTRFANMNNIILYYETNEEFVDNKHSMISYIDSIITVIDYALEIMLTAKVIPSERNSVRLENPIKYSTICKFHYNDEQWKTLCNLLAPDYDSKFIDEIDIELEGATNVYFVKERDEE